jgi:hypothetical protein
MTENPSPGSPLVETEGALWTNRSRRKTKRGGKGIDSFDHGSGPAREQGITIDVLPISQRPSGSSSSPIPGTKALRLNDASADLAVISSTRNGSMTQTRGMLSSLTCLGSATSSSR